LITELQTVQEDMVCPGIWTIFCRIWKNLSDNCGPSDIFWHSTLNSCLSPTHILIHDLFAPTAETTNTGSAML